MISHLLVGTQMVVAASPFLFMWYVFSACWPIVNPLCLPISAIETPCVGE